MSNTATQQLQLRIEQLELERKKLESVIINDVKFISATIKNPAPYIRSTVAELAAEKTFFVDLMTIVLQYVTSYVAGKIGRNVSNSGFFSELFKSFNEQEGDKTSVILNLVKSLFRKKGNQQGDDTASK
jgi:hypothetical protein